VVRRVLVASGQREACLRTKRLHYYSNATLDVAIMPRGPTSSLWGLAQRWSFRRSGREVDPSCKSACKWNVCCISPGKSGACRSRPVGAPAVAAGGCFLGGEATSRGGGPAPGARRRQAAGAELDSPHL